CKDGMYCQVKVEYAFDAQMLRKKYALVHYDSPWPLIKEYVPGVGAACFFLRHQGKILARFQHQRIRETNPTGSGSCLRVSVAPDPALMRSEERRVGKECRARGARWRDKKRKTVQVDDGVV